jgi:hypothetical protein
MGFLLLQAGQAQALFVETDFFSNVAVTFNLLHPGGAAEAVNLTGTATQTVTFPTTEGSAGDGDTDGLDDVPTEMIALNLTGVSSLGTVNVGLNTGMASLGTIEELANNTAGVLDVPPFTATGAATSFFDVFFEIEIAGQSLFNTDPAEIAGLINHKPPLDISGILGSFAPVALADENGQSTGFGVEGAGATAIAEPGTVALFVFGLAGLALARRRHAA